MRLDLRPLALSLAAALLAPLAPAQTTWHVPDDFPGIQAALDAAAPGDTVVVGPGTWYVNNLALQKDLVLRSEAGPADTVLDGDFDGRILQVSSGVTAAARIEGFHFTRGRADGGAIRMLGASEPTIVGCRFGSNWAPSGSYGANGEPGEVGELGEDGGEGSPGVPGGGGADAGAILVTAGSPRIVACHFHFNRAGDGGNGGDGGAGGRGGIAKSTIIPSQHMPTDGGPGGPGGVGGEAGHGGAIAVRLGTVTLVDCYFDQNSAGRGGMGGDGGPGGDPGPSLFFPLLIGDQGVGGAGGDGGVGGRGGALHADKAAAGFRVVNCTFKDNRAGSGGLRGSGGFGSSFGDPGAHGAIGHGSAVDVREAGSLAIANSILWKNPVFSEVLHATTQASPWTVTHCVSDFPPYAGPGNFEAEPLLDLQTGEYPFGSFALLPGSPCIDAGAAAEYAAVWTTGLAEDGFGNPRFTDDPASPDGPAAGQPAIDIGAAEYVPPASIALLACSLNPAGSFEFVSGAPHPGETLRFAVQNPLGTQGIGFVFGVIGLGASTTEPDPCGLALPGFGMSGPGALGGLAVNPSPGLSLPPKLAGVWNGSPVYWNVPVPDSPAVLGLVLTLQAVIAEANPGAVPLALTRAATLQIGT